ncbi:ABC transporter permease [Streptomyces sp. NPDC056061]|uniref:ABC transporter permease n=1 Tax=Streptomyces sp. NPDC056061 TaxID=3345700 RepID=UPI0035D7B02C
MTAPLTPPHRPSSDDPWQTPPRWDGPGGSHPVPSAPQGEGDVGRELLGAAAVTLLVAVTGVGLGVLWAWLAPKVPLISDGTAVFLRDSEGEEAIGADGTFVLLAPAFGALSAALVFWFRRRGGIAVVVGLALGGVLGSLLAWRLGVWLGPEQDVVAHARAVGKGVVFDAPLQLRAVWVAWLAWPVTAMAVHLALTALFGPRDPEPEWGVFPGWAAGGPVPGAGYGAPVPGAPGNETAPPTPPAAS